MVVVVVIGVIFNKQIHILDQIFYISTVMSSSKSMKSFYFQIQLGIVRVDDSFKYPIRRFGYPPMTQPQHIYQSTSNHDLPNPPSSPPPKTPEQLTWSATAELNRRPSLSPYMNRYQQHAKEGFAYWPRDSFQRPRCKMKIKLMKFCDLFVSVFYFSCLGKSGTTGTFKTWLGLSDSILKL